MEAQLFQLVSGGWTYAREVFYNLVFSDGFLTHQGSLETMDRSLLCVTI